MAETDRIADMSELVDDVFLGVLQRAKKKKEDPSPAMMTAILKRLQQVGVATPKSDGKVQDIVAKLKETKLKYHGGLPPLDVDGRDAATG